MEALFYGLKPNKRRIIEGKRNVWGHQLYLAGLRLSDGEMLIVATSSFPENSIDTYALRWEIETLFGCLKGRGFNFEDTHITDLDRIKKLFALLAIAFCWAHKTGEWRHETNPIKIKKHGRPAISLFRYGLDYIVQAIAKMAFCAELFENFLSFIIPNQAPILLGESP